MTVVIKLIGIGLGNSKHLTLEAIEAISSCDLIFLGEKKAEKSELAELKKEVCLSHIDPKKTVLQSFIFPERKNEGIAYQDSVSHWHKEIANSWVELILKYLDMNKRLETNIGIPVWGDPSLYDSSLRVVEKVKGRIKGLKVNMISGLSSAQILTSSFGITFNEVGKEVIITTGRKLKEKGWPKSANTVFVMLDGECSFQFLTDPDLYIWWGAYLGLERETLLQGNLHEKKQDIVKLRKKLRARFGWIMDIYKIQKIKRK